MSTFRYSVFKRLFDIVAATFLIIILFPVMIVCIALIRLTSPGPAIIRQRRLTSGGREFGMLKFRSMSQNAEAETGAVWAQSDDKRVTRVGKILRRYHLDELPQLFNILSGSMSIIGPRPERPEFSEMLSGQFRSFHHRWEVPAGLTGLAQINHGYCSSMGSYRRKIALDRLYVQRRSLTLDFIIAVKTLPVVLSGYQREFHQGV